VKSQMYVCFQCRKSRRYRSRPPEDPVCQFCSNTMIYAFYKYEMPAADDSKGWEAYRHKVMKYNREAADAMVKDYRAKVASITAILEKTDQRNIKRVNELETLLAEKNAVVTYWNNYLVKSGEIQGK